MNSIKNLGNQLISKQISDKTINPFGTEATKYFYDLTPEKILTAVEDVGLKCTGRVLTLNSMENRVYEVEIEVDDETLKSPSERFRIVKFYRPGRWSRDQINDEHQFLMDLKECEIPVVAPLTFLDGQSVMTMSDLGIHYAIFPKVGGRNPDELTDEQLTQIGRLMGRMHGVGRSKDAQHRIKLNPETYGLNNLAFLLSADLIPTSIRPKYEQVVKEICQISEPLFKTARSQRIHGDCHMGNLLWGSEGPFWVDFDDMVVGPQMQDLWLIVPGRDEESQRQLSLLLTGYEQMCDFDRATLKLFEPLRALRFIHFSAWIGKRWEDPAFKRTFINYGSDGYWQEQLNDLYEQLDLIRDAVSL